MDIVKESNPEMLEISCHYASSGSTAVGCFMVAQYLDRETPPVYRAVHKKTHAHANNTFTFNGVGIKHVSVYEIETNLFPGRFPAHVEMLFTNSSTPQGMVRTVMPDGCINY